MSTVVKSTGQKVVSMKWDGVEQIVTDDRNRVSFWKDEVLLY